MLTRKTSETTSSDLGEKRLDFEHESNTCPVPARPDSLNSPEVDDTDAEFARRFHTGSRSTSFPDEIKWIIELTDSNGLCGVGETYRGPTAESVTDALRPLMSCDVL
jgi:hypothetical protein